TACSTPPATRFWPRSAHWSTRRPGRACARPGISPADCGADDTAEQTGPGAVGRDRRPGALAFLPCRDGTAPLVMRLLLVLLAIAAALAAAAFLVRFEYAPVPATADLLNPERRTLDVAYDVLGREITRSEADELLQTGDGKRRLSPAEGAIRVDDDLRQLGREAFYSESFGNEWFMTDVMGLTRGALTPFQVAKAVLKLRGRGTSDLQVELAQP